MPDEIDLQATLEEADHRYQMARNELDTAYSRAREAMVHGRLGEAGGICDDILVSVPDCPEAFALLGEIANKRNDADRALSLLRRAVELKDDAPDWHLLLSQLYLQTGRVSEALRAAMSAQSYAPASPEPLLQLARVYAQGLPDRGQEIDDQVRSCLLRALALDQDHAGAHMALGEFLLTIGDTMAGLHEYEWRLKVPHVVKDYPIFRSARWNGMKIPDGRVLVVAEGGYGDVIQFTRYLPLVAERCQEVILTAPPELAPLLRYAGGAVVTRYEDVPPHAAHIHLMSLPRLFHPADLLPTLLFTPGKALHDAHARLAPNPKRLTIGICWAGRPTHPFDRMRSMPLMALAPLAELSKAVLVSLQQPFPEEDSAELNVLTWATLFKPHFADWTETAAMIRHLDVVVTVDTAVAHLAATLGVKTLMMTAPCNDWRWGRDTTTTHWYPSNMTIYRRTSESWAPVVNEVVEELRRMQAEK